MSLHRPSGVRVHRKEVVARRWIVASFCGTSLFALSLVVHGAFGGAGAAGSRLLLGVGSAIIALGAFAVAHRSGRRSDGPEVAFLGLGVAGILRTLLGFDVVEPGADQVEAALTIDVLTIIAYSGALLLAAAGRRRLLQAAAIFTAAMPTLSTAMGTQAGPTLTGAALVAAGAAASLTLFRRDTSDGTTLSVRAGAIGAALGLAAILGPWSADTAGAMLRAAVAAPLAGLMVVTIVREAPLMRRSLLPRLRLTMVSATFLWAALAAAFGVAAIGRGSDALMSPLLTSVISVGFGFTMIGLLVVTATTTRITDELEELASATRSLARGRFKGRIPVDSSRELSRLALSFNAMAERIHLQREELLILARVMEGTSDPVAVVGTDGRIVFANGAFSTSTGWGALDLVGREFVTMLSPRSEDESLDSLADALSTEDPWAREVLVAAHGGRKFSGFTSVVPVHNEGRLLYHVAVVRDLRTLKKLESERATFAENLLEIHAVGRGLVSTLEADEIHENVVAGVAERFGARARVWVVAEGEPCNDCILDADARHLHWVETTTGHDAAPSMKCIPFGLTLPGLAAQNMSREVLSDDVPRAMLAHEARGAAGGDGTRVAFPIVVEGELLGVLEVHQIEPRSRFIDTMQLLVPTLAAALFNARLHRKVVHQARALEELTGALESTATRQRGHAEELRAINQKLIEADRLKSRFLSTTSHELRTPLSGCLGFLSLILDGMATDRDEELEFVREAHGCARNLLETINVVLDIAKIEAGRIPIEPRRVDAQALIDDVIASHRPGDLEVVVDVAPNTWLRVDYKQARKALAQLVDNAIKFTDEGGVRVTARPCPERGLVEIKIADTGIGLSETDVTPLFDAFVQGESGDDRRFGGSGLGLTLCRELTRMMGGSVRLAANDEDGATAVLNLPIHRVEAFQPDKPVDASHAAGDLVVLLVDGDAEYIEMARAMINEIRPTRIEVASSAPEAVRRAQKLLPDWILTEYALPFDGQPTLVTGLDLAGTIAQDHGGDINVAIVTGHLPEEEAVAGQLERLGVPLLQKPLTRAALCQLLEDPTEEELTAYPFRVLLVDDDPGVDETVKLALDQGLFEVQSVRDGHEALYRLSRPAETYDVVLLDLLMPGISGYEVLQTLRNDLASRLPVVVLSNDVETDEQRSLLNECDVRRVIAKDRISSAPHKLARAVVEATRTTE